MHALPAWYSTASTNRAQCRMNKFNKHGSKDMPAREGFAGVQRRKSTIEGVNSSFDILFVDMVRSRIRGE